MQVSPEKRRCLASPNAAQMASPAEKHCFQGEEVHRPAHTGPSPGLQEQQKGLLRARRSAKALQLH